MIVQINDQQYSVDIKSINNLSEIITVLESKIEPNHLITKVMLNDKDLGPNWFFEAKNVFLIDADKLYVTTEKADVVADEVLQKSKEQFNAIMTDFEKIAELFRVDDEKKANEKFAQGIENLQYYFQIMEDLAKLYGTDLNQIKFSDHNVKELLSSLSSKLTEIIEIQQNKDWILLADFIEFELMPMLKDFNNIYRLLNKE